MSWLEVSLIVDGELAEAVAEVLARYAPSGVVIESTAIKSDSTAEGQPVGPMRVCAYLPVDEEIKDTRWQIEQSLWHLGRIQPLPDPKFQTIDEVNWAESWKENYQPILIGERLLILPAWMNVPEGERIPILIDPGMAFGTGVHPSTQLCLLMLQELTPIGKVVFDIGCGSGILSIAALKLGAARAYGVDIEPESIENANKNSAANQVQNRAAFALGSVQEIQKGLFELRRAPLVLANILAHILKRLLQHGLADLVSPGGVLVLSGILEEQLPEIVAMTSAQGLHLIARRQIDDWVVIALEK